MSATEEPERDAKGKKTTRSHRLIRILLLVIVLTSVIVGLFWYVCVRMPGTSHSPANVADQAAPKPVSISEHLQRHVIHLGETIGERNLQTYPSLCKAADYVEEQLKTAGYSTKRQTYQVNNLDCQNIIAEVKGNQQHDEIIIVGAHYDSVTGTPGANDNGSGVASMLVLANQLRDYQPGKTLRFVGFTNEEPPYFQHRGEMGSWVYAESCRKAGDKIVGVLSLETMGYFSDEENSQKYPPPLNAFYPSTGNFIGFVSNIGSSQLQRRVIKVFRDHANIASEGASLPSSVPGVGWSDHWSFWQEGYPGIMVTDTAPFRYPHYHESTDTPDKLDYDKLAEVTRVLEIVVRDLCTAEE